MTLIWSEDFQSGLSKWRIQTGENWDNGATDQRYTNRLENVRTTPEGLVIECRRERMAGSIREFTSARIDSRGTLVLRSGYIEVVAKVELTQGSWPQIWTLGGEAGYRRGWPGGGEIDLVEFTHGNVMLNVHAGSPHWQYGWGSRGARQPPPGEGFHAYGAFFDETRVVLYVDREPKVTVNRGARSALDWPFGTEPQWVILNYATGSYGGEPLNGTWPRRMTVQSVSAYDAVPAVTPPVVVPPPPVVPPPLDLAGIRADLSTAQSAVEAAIRKLES